MNIEKLKKTAERMVAPGKGILAADESTGTIGKRFDKIELENTEENRRVWREALLTAPGIGTFISGVIMFDETIRQSTRDGGRFVDILKSEGVLAGIKVDQSTASQESSPDEKITKGLEGLPERLEEYALLGAAFAKWRAVITIDEVRGLPTDGNIRQNARDLARYAKDAQEAGLVPIVEPEVLMDGSHNAEACAEATEKALAVLFEELENEGVAVEGIVLKTNMILPGTESKEVLTPNEVATATLAVFKKVLPANLPGVAFLSGGQGEIEATENLNAMQKMGDFPWHVSFSYGRALQQSALTTWKGDVGKVAEAQKRFLHRARMNALATLGQYARTLEESA